VVFVVGATDTVLPVTAPMPGVIASEVAPFTAQLSVVELPRTTLGGVAVKEVIVGFGGGAVTGSVSVCVVVPAALRAVSV
jgi:hypothetical protein